MTNHNKNKKKSRKLYGKKNRSNTLNDKNNNKSNKNKRSKQHKKAKNGKKKKSLKLDKTMKGQTLSKPYKGYKLTMEIAGQKMCGTRKCYFVYCKFPKDNPAKESKCDNEPINWQSINSHLLHVHSIHFGTNDKGLLYEFKINLT